MNKAIRFLILVGLVLVGVAASVGYWLTSVPIPDVQGMTIPQAEAALNAAGLRIGEWVSVDEEDSSGTPDRVVGQSAPSFWRLPQGSSVDLSVLRKNNVLLRYDVPPPEETPGNTLNERWFNIINLTNEELYIGNLRFVSAEDEAISVDQSNWDWAHDDLLSGQCLQMMPINITFITPQECQPSFLRQSVPITDEARQFWIPGDAFHVYQGSIRRATCQIAADECAFWIEEAEVTRELTSYFYFIYEQNTLTIFNRSADRWMPINEVSINGNRNLGRERYERLPFLMNDDLLNLAPQQCIQLTSHSEKPEAAPGCVQVIGWQTDAEAFWRESFRVSGVDCAAALEEGSNICIVPRR